MSDNGNTTMTSTTLPGGLTDAINAASQEDGCYLAPYYIPGISDMSVESLATIVSNKDHVIPPKAVRFAPTKPEEVFGILKFLGKPKSIEEMDAGMTAKVEHRLLTFDKRMARTAAQAGGVPVLEL